MLNSVFAYIRQEELKLIAPSHVPTLFPWKSPMYFRVTKVLIPVSPIFAHFGKSSHMPKVHAPCQQTLVTTRHYESPMQNISIKKMAGCVDTVEVRTFLWRGKERFGSYRNFRICFQAWISSCMALGLGKCPGKMRQAEWVY
jgi:hypothetical protein